jgi:hypothetical protein
MTEPAPNGVVHQAFFGWSHDAGGMALFSHSFPRPDEATRWMRRLEAHLRLIPVPGEELPSRALSYFTYEDGSAAVLHRVNAGYTHGRNYSHALIGSSATLNVTAALGLGSWKGWQARPPPSGMVPIPAALFPAAEAAAQRLRPLAERRERELVVGLTRLLDNPRDPLSIIGCLSDRLAMVWGLREAADDYLRQLGQHRSWSFSTYEDRHDVTVEGLPEIVFLAAEPPGAAVVHRTIVELDRYPAVSPNITLASELVSKLLRGTPLRTPGPIGGSGMTTPDGQLAPRRVRCPICADDFHWPNDSTISLYDEENGRYQLVDISGLNPVKQADLTRRGYRQCPNPSGDTAPHYLPATYANYRDPLVIGLVGAPDSGKTHLLTAMIRQAYRGGLGAYGIRTSALDFLRHAAFHEQFIVPFEKGDALPGTGTGIADAADILLLRGPGGERPVTFFDVAGEDLESTAVLKRPARFLIGANALIFVYASEDPLETKKPAAASENRSFDLAVERLQGLPGGTDGRPAVIVVMKSDRLRYVPPADRWLRRDDRTVSAARIRAESRDVYTYLHHVEAGASLRPFEAFTRCTLHFVSASGGDAIPVNPGGEISKNYFPRGVRPTRVLEPLVSILAMTGMITGPEAEKVGAP